MATLTRFEDLKAWQIARALTREVYRVSKNEGFRDDRRLINQVTAASVSIMANIAEGFDRGGNKEFLNFLSIAKASVAEVKSELYVALDQKYLTEHDFKMIYDMAEENGRVIGGLMNYLRSSEFKGTKFIKK